MKKLILLTSFALFSTAALFAQNGDKEVALYQNYGATLAYVYKDLVIYWYDGTPVTYSKTDNQSYPVYAFNGKHKGWYKSGTLYDKQGKVIGVTNATGKGLSSYEPNKWPKKFLPIKYNEEFVSFEPALYSFASKISLETFLKVDQK